MEIIRQVKSFLVSKYITYNTDDRVLFCNHVTVDRDVDSQNYFEFLNSLYFIEDEATISLFENKKQKISEKSLLIQSISKDGRAIFSNNFKFDNGDFLLDYYLSNLLDRNLGYQFLCSGYYTNFLIEGRIFCFKPKDKTVCAFAYDGNPIWNFLLSNLRDYRNIDDNVITSDLLNIIGVYSGKLWLYLNGFRLVAISVDTGSVIHEVYLYDQFALQPCSVAYHSLAIDNIHLDETTGVIKSLSHRFYWELDLKNLLCSIKKDFGEQTGDNWRITRSRYYEGDKNLYFIGSKKGEAVNRTVGIFDTETCEVVWEDSPLEEKKFLFFTDAPQANKNILGVLDSEMNLRIYDR